MAIAAAADGHTHRVAGCVLEAVVRLSDPELLEEPSELGTEGRRLAGFGRRQAVCRQLLGTADQPVETGIACEVLAPGRGRSVSRSSVVTRLGHRLRDECRQSSCSFVAERAGDIGQVADHRHARPHDPVTDGTDTVSPGVPDYGMAATERDLLESRLARIEQSLRVLERRVDLFEQPAPRPELPSPIGDSLTLSVNTRTRQTALRTPTATPRTSPDSD